MGMIRCLVSVLLFSGLVFCYDYKDRLQEYNTLEKKKSEIKFDSLDFKVSEWQQKGSIEDLEIAQYSTQNVLQSQNKVDFEKSFQKIDENDKVQSVWLKHFHRRRRKAEDNVTVTEPPVSTTQTAGYSAFDSNDIPEVSVVPSSLDNASSATTTTVIPAAAPPFLSAPSLDNATDTSLVQNSSDGTVSVSSATSSVGVSVTSPTNISSVAVNSTSAQSVASSSSVESSSGISTTISNSVWIASSSLTTVLSSVSDSVSSVSASLAGSVVTSSSVLPVSSSSSEHVVSSSSSEHVSSSSSESSLDAYSSISDESSLLTSTARPSLATSTLDAVVLSSTSVEPSFQDGASFLSQVQPSQVQTSSPSASSTSETNGLHTSVLSASMPVDESSAISNTTGVSSVPQSSVAVEDFSKADDVLLKQTTVDTSVSSVTSADSSVSENLRGSSVLTQSAVPVSPTTSPVITSSVTSYDILTSQTAAEFVTSSSDSFSSSSSSIQPSFTVSSEITEIGDSVSTSLKTSSTPYLDLTSTFVSIEPVTSVSTSREVYSSQNVSIGTGPVEIDSTVTSDLPVSNASLNETAVQLSTFVSLTSSIDNRVEVDDIPDISLSKSTSPGTTKADNAIPEIFPTESSSAVSSKQTTSSLSSPYSSEWQVSVTPTPEPTSVASVTKIVTHKTMTSVTEVVTSSSSVTSSVMTPSPTTDDVLEPEMTPLVSNTTTATDIPSFLQTNKVELSDITSVATPESTSWNASSQSVQTSTVMILPTSTQDSKLSVSQTEPVPSPEPSPSELTTPNTTGKQPTPEPTIVASLSTPENTVLTSMPVPESTTWASTTESEPMPTSVSTSMPTPEPFTTRLTTKTTPEATTEPLSDPTTEPTVKATLKPTTEPTLMSTPEPTTVSSRKPTPEPSTVSSPKSTPKPTSKPSPKPTTEPLPAPTTEPLPEPTTEPLPEPTTEPYPEPTSEPNDTKPEPTDNEPEVEPDPFAEPGPDWVLAKETWREAWEFHIYFFGAAFVLLGIYCTISIVRLWKMDHLLSRHYFLTLNVLVIIVCVFRALYLLVDAYNSNGTFPRVVDYFIYSTVFPCLTAMFSILFYALLLATRIQVLSQKVQKLWVLLVIIVFHFCLSIATDIVVGLFASASIMLFVCQFFFILWGLLMFIGYLVIFRRLYSVALTRQKAIQKVVHEKRLNGAARTQDDTKQKFTVGLAVKVTFVSSIFGLACIGFELYGMFGVYGALRSQTKKPEPWPWWTYHMAVRTLEILMCSSIAYVAAQPFKYIYNKNRKLKLVYLLPCQLMCCKIKGSDRVDGDFSSYSLEHYVSESETNNLHKKKPKSPGGKRAMPGPPPPHSSARYNDPDATLLVRKVLKPSMLVVEDGFVRIRREDELPADGIIPIGDGDSFGGSVDCVSNSAGTDIGTVSIESGSLESFDRNIGTTVEGVANKAFTQEDFQGFAVDNSDDDCNERAVENVKESVTRTQSSNSDANTADIFRPISLIDFAASMESELEKAFHSSHVDDLDLISHNSLPTSFERMSNNSNEFHYNEELYERYGDDSAMLPYRQGETIEICPGSPVSHSGSVNIRLIPTPVRRTRSEDPSIKSKVFDKNMYFSLTDIEKAGKDDSHNSSFTETQYHNGNIPYTEL